MNYVEKNRGYITASKFKLYVTCPEAYDKVYNQEVDTSFIKESKALENGTMIDEFLLSPSKFTKNYAFPNGSGLKQDLVDACLELGIPVEKTDKVEDLKSKLYGNRDVLTTGEVDMLLNIKKELSRQPLYDMDGLYETQKSLEATYTNDNGSLVLKGTIDRLSVEKGLIRDLKTSKDITYNNYHDCSNFEKSLAFNDEYQYILQLSRYFLLCKLTYGKDFDCIIDGVKTTAPYASQFFTISKEVIVNTVNTIIIPGLNDIIIRNKNNDWSASINRDILLDNRYYPILDSAIQKDFINL